MPEQPPLTEEQKKELQEKIKNMSPEQLLQLQKQQCIFCQIVAGKIPSKKIYEDQFCLAVLDINPATKGHILILPKEHYAIMPQVPDEPLAYLFTAAKKISQALLRGLKMSGTNIFIANGLAAGQKSQHFMLHLIPRKEGDKLFELEEKLVDSDTRNKVKSAIENTLNQVLKIKRDVVNVEEKKVPKVISDKKKEAAQKKAEPTPKEPTKKTPQKEKAETSRKSEDVSLDDIANLFK
ncbi:MAG TPA: HIT domain-containing protein [Candidatus Nanoarchaeia archaeon]|nr:HIT domain-containing protein [Candidatus Nanoarchaeia archaeon]